MSDIRFSKDHEWIRVEGDVGTVGITDYAQEQLGDIVFVELPDVGRELQRKGDAAVIESVKAASEVYAPISGKVTEANDALADDPAKINSDPMGQGWFFKMTIGNTSELDDLMDEDAYKAFVESLG